MKNQNSVVAPHRRVKSVSLERSAHFISPKPAKAVETNKRGKLTVKSRFAIADAWKKAKAEGKCPTEFAYDFTATRLKGKALEVIAYVKSLEIVVETSEKEIEAVLRVPEGLRTEREKKLVRAYNKKPEAYCSSCKKKTVTLNPETVMTRKGKPMLKGDCATCGSKVSSFK